MPGHPSNPAALLPALGADLVVEERAIPEPGEDEILVRNYAVALNPVDWKRQSTGYAIPSYPAILGSGRWNFLVSGLLSDFQQRTNKAPDVSGVVAAVGTSVSEFRPGDRVVAYTSSAWLGTLDAGAFQTYSIAKALTTAKLPDKLDFKEAAVIPLGFVTAITAYVGSLGVPLPATAAPSSKKAAVLVWGGSSSVGSNAVQIGRRLGFTVFTTASPAHHEYLRSLGADAVFDYHSPDVVDEILVAAERAGKPIKYAVDAVSLAESLQPSAQVLERSGGRGSRLATVLPWPGTLPQPKGVEIVPVAVWKTLGDERVAEWAFKEFLATGLESGDFQPSPEVQLVDGGLEGLQTGLNILKRGVSGKKIVVELR